MPLEFSWQLPSMQDDTLSQWQARPGDWIQLALAVEYAGLEGLWIGNGPGQPDSLGVAAALCAHTRKLILTVSVAPEVMLPAALASTLQSLQSISQQRIRLHLPDSGRNSAYRAFGEFLNRDQRNERIGEYLALLSRLLAPLNEPFNHTGRYFQLENAGIAHRDLCAPPLLLDASQDPELTGRIADQCLLSLAPLPALARQIQRLRDSAVAHGRALSLACQLGLILGDSEDQAWCQAEQHLASLGVTAPAADPRVSDLARPFAETRRLEIHPNLWQPETGGTVFLVGTPEQCAARLQTLHELGIGHVVISAEQPIRAVLRFAEQVVPLLETCGLRKESRYRA
ncbi:LLM class flavin-dependent oxidoreductase [Pseudomonas sp. Pseusp122]|uniref:LLM class flavin-dependent oxidoreductase n=1 Tax=unclassified Pseudomonas TaxID=196821 RepID=UPI0039A4286C